KHSRINGLCTNAGDGSVDKAGVKRAGPDTARPGGNWLFSAQLPDDRRPVGARAAGCAVHDSQASERLRRFSQISRLYTKSPAQMQAKASSVLGEKCSSNSRMACSSTSVGARYCRKPRVV